MATTKAKSMNQYVTRKLPLESNGTIASDARGVVLAYLTIIVTAELLGVAIGIVPSIVCHAVLIVVLFNHYILVNHAAYRRILPIFALAPLLRILSLIMPLTNVPQTYWYVLIGLPLLVAMILTLRLLRLSWASVGLRLHAWSSQLLIASSGLPCSIVAFLIGRPQPLVTTLDWQYLLPSAVVLLVFTAFVEELLFRGMLQRVATDTFGRVGMLYSSAMFVALYLGSRSLSYIIFVGVLGLFWSWCVYRTRSLWGTVFAHGFVNIGMLLIWPLVWG